MTEPTRTLVLELARQGYGWRDAMVKLKLPKEMGPEVRRLVLSNTEYEPSKLTNVYWRNIRLIKKVG
jgi:hypothetical protein